MDELTREERIALVEQKIHAAGRAEQATKDARRLERQYKKAEREGASPAELRALVLQVADAFERAGALHDQAAQAARAVAAAMPMGVTVGEWVEGEVKRN